MFSICLLLMPLKYICIHQSNTHIPQKVSQSRRIVSHKTKSFGCRCNSINCHQATEQNAEEQMCKYVLLKSLTALHNYIIYVCMWISREYGTIHCCCVVECNCRCRKIETPFRPTYAKIEFYATTLFAQYNEIQLYTLQQQIEYPYSIRCSDSSTNHKSKKN